MIEASKVHRIAFVGNHLPRKCGLCYLKLAEVEVYSAGSASTPDYGPFKGVRAGDKTRS
jgi:hypothetical protein